MSLESDRQATKPIVARTGAREATRVLRKCDDLGFSAMRFVTRLGQLALAPYRLINSRFCVRCALTTLRPNVRTPGVKNNLAIIKRNRARSALCSRATGELDDD
jgi:hypothetical protein